MQRKEKVARLVGEFAAGMTRLLGSLVRGWTEIDESDDRMVEQSMREISCQMGVGGTDIPNCPMGDDISTGTSKGADIPVTSVHNCPNFSPLKDVQMMKSQHKDQQLDNVFSKGIVIQTPPANNVRSADVYVAASETARVTRSASTPIRSQNIVQETVESMDSDAEHSHSLGGDSDHCDEEDVDRFIIRSRKCVDHKHDDMIGAEKVAASDTYYHDSVCTGLDSLADATVVEEGGDLIDVRHTGSKCFLSSDKDQLCYSDIQVNEKNVGRDDAYAAGKDAAAVNPDRYANKKTSIYFKRFVYHRILFFIWLYSVSIFFCCSFALFQPI